MTDEQRASRAEYEIALKELFTGMTDDEVYAEMYQHIEWRHWQDADYCHDELRRRERERVAYRDRYGEATP